VLLPHTNKNLEKPLLIGEFCQWIGLVFLLSTICGSDRQDFWSLDEISAFVGAPLRLRGFMARTRFEEIIAALRLTDQPLPAYKDGFFQVWQMIKAWNKTMSDNFIPSWINLIDELMVAWTTKYSCPGWMVVPRKPHPLGNKYHSICCGQTGIMYGIELVEGKDRPPQLGPKMYVEKGETVGLLLWITKPIHGTGKCCIMDSGFAVLDGLLELKHLVVYGTMVVKQKRFWPKVIQSDEINQYMANKQTSEVCAIKGVKNGKSFYVFTMKEPDYVMILMGTFGTLVEVNNGGTKRIYQDPMTGATVTKSFKYAKPFYHHYKYRHQVDDHNAKRHAPISVEDALGLRNWEQWQFTFLLVLTEVNVKLVLKGFSDNEEQAMLTFRKKLAQELINNVWWEEEQVAEGLLEAQRSSTHWKRDHHELKLRPPNSGQWNEIYDCSLRQRRNTRC
jgi:roadblock/LC7 domain-containing protein